MSEAEREAFEEAADELAREIHGWTRTFGWTRTGVKSFAGDVHVYLQPPGGGSVCVPLHPKSIERRMAKHRAEDGEPKALNVALTPEEAAKLKADLDAAPAMLVEAVPKRTPFEHELLRAERERGRKEGRDSVTGACWNLVNGQPVKGKKLTPLELVQALAAEFAEGREAE